MEKPEIMAVLFFVIDDEGTAVGYTTDEALAKRYCDEENRKTYPFTYGYGVHFVPVEPMKFDNHTEV
ncbi:hypothetical protein [Cohnella silvisoli]|uniref:hypothetical protein n=1 Tax=Cohnella silvisoli TaxID=2873699 RepID=UPI0032DAF553